jgi:mycofactocin precursor
MQQDTRADATPADAPPPVSDDLDAGREPEIAEELLVEEISIDGMCGVY